MKKYINKMMRKIEKAVQKIGEEKCYKCLLVFFFVCAILMLFLPGITIGHDIYFHLSRIEGITEGLQNGTFPVLIYPGYLSGYGYANGVFYPDIFLYIPALFHLLGYSTILSYKIFLFIITLGILLSMYFCTFKITKSKFTATMISVLYLMSSYRITDTWVRAAVGETLTFIFLPFVVLGLYKLIYDNEKEWYYLTIGLIGIVLSHLLSGLLCILLVGAFGLINIKKLWKEKNRLKYSLMAGCLAIGMTLFFTAPLLEMMLSDTFVYQTYSNGAMVVERSVFPLLTLIEFPPGIEPWIPQGIGIVFLFLFWYFRKSKIKDENNKKFKTICLYTGLFFLFMSTSLFPWGILGKILGMIQFPWRFYILVTILFLFGFAIDMKEASEKLSKRVSMALILSIFALGTFGIGSMYALRADQLDKVAKHSIIWGEYVPEDVDITEYAKRGDVITSNHEVDTTFTKEGTTITVNYQNNSNEDTYLELPLMYYKGYMATSDNEELQIEKGNNGMIRVYLEEEAGNFEVSYGWTGIRIFGMVASIIFTGLFIGMIIYTKKKKV